MYESWNETSSEFLSPPSFNDRLESWRARFSVCKLEVNLACTNYDIGGRQESKRRQVGFSRVISDVANRSTRIRTPSSRNAALWQQLGIRANKWRTRVLGPARIANL
jgi:hypothetical protein